MKKTKLGVAFGGQSSEYGVSLHSVASFLRQFNKDKYDTVLIGISKNGGFYIVEPDIQAIEDDKWQSNAHRASWVAGGIVDMVTGKEYPLDVVFPVLHGKNGEDGAMQGLLQMLNIHCVGCDVLGSALCMDKELMHVVLKEAGIPQAKYICLKDYDAIPEFEEISETLKLPWVVKPCNAGSSYGVSFVETSEQFERALMEAFRYDGRGKILVEEAVDGFEIGCAVMGTPENLCAGSVDEISTTAPVFDFEGKYHMRDTEIYCPARIANDKLEDARSFAKTVYKALNCRGMARVDMFYTKDGSLVVNEVNTIPGMTATSRYPTMMKVAGIEFPDLIDTLVGLALKQETGVE